MSNKSGSQANNSQFSNSTDQTNDQLLKRPRTSEINRVIIDGSNVCYWNGSPSLKPVLTLMNELLRRNMQFDSIFDASIRHKLGDEKPVYDFLEKKYRRYFNQAPAGDQADTYILMAADVIPNTAIISQDRFQKYGSEYSWLLSGNRLFSGMIIDNRLFVRALHINVEIPSRLNTLQKEFEVLVAPPPKTVGTQFNTITMGYHSPFYILLLVL